MSGFVGWKLEGSTAIPGTRFDGLWPHARIDVTQGLPTGQGLAVATTREPVSTHRAEAGWAIVIGWPRWHDPELEQLGADSGAAAATLAAMARFGPDFGARLGGSFAVALVSATSVVLAVDRMATRPLGFCATPHGIVFGTSVEAIRRHPGVVTSIDLQATYDYFFFHVVPSPRTIYRGIEKLEPGQIVVHAEGRARRRSAWQPTLWRATTPEETEDLHAAVPATLEQAVRDCGPNSGCGAYLSGGLDSSAVAGFLSRQRPAPTPVFTVGFDQKGYDEMEYARIAARHFGLALREIYVTPAEIANAFEKIASAYDEPFGNSSAAPAFLCAERAAAEGVHSLLAGDGGDELFGGNDRYVRQQIFEHYKQLPEWSRRNVLEPFVTRADWLGRLPVLRKAASYVRQASIPMPDRTQTYNLVCRLGPDTIFEPDFLSAIDPDGPLNSLRQRYQAAHTDSLLGQMLYLDWKFTLADNDLPKVRVTAELADVGVQFPMLDDRVIDLSIRVPDDQKIAGGTLRKFYKDALADFLPGEILTKKKHGFGLPFGEWLQDSEALRTVIGDAISDLRNARIVKRDFLDGLVNRRHQEHAAYYGGSIWIFAMFARWLTQHDVRVP